MNNYLLRRKCTHLSKRILVAILRCAPVIRKHYRFKSRRDGVIEVCDLIQSARSDSGSRVTNKKLERQLSSFGINFEQMPSRQKHDLCALFADHPLQPDRYDELKQHTYKIPAQLLKCRQWLNLHEMCCFRGRYTLGQIFREKARLLAVKPLEGRAYKPPISWANTIGAAIEGGECHRSDHLDQLLDRAGISGYYASKWHLYMTVLNGQEIAQESVERFEGSGFADYLAGKTIAVVGPAPTRATDAEEIDSHDLVVRLNHSYERKGTDPEHKGLRTDITCFNGEQTNVLIEERDGVLPKEVSWGCFKNSNRARRVGKKNPEKYTRSHITFYENQFHGSFNMMPIVALDFSLFATKSVKVYHTDLMLTVPRQKGYYPKSMERFGCQKDPVRAFLAGGIMHDPIQQFTLLSRLFFNGKITGDHRFCEVMHMGLKEYCAALETVYAS